MYCAQCYRSERCECRSSCGENGSVEPSIITRSPILLDILSDEVEERSIIKLQMSCLGNVDLSRYKLKL